MFPVNDEGGDCRAVYDAVEPLFALGEVSFSLYPMEFHVLQVPDPLLEAIQTKGQGLSIDAFILHEPSGAETLP